MVTHPGTDATWAELLALRQAVDAGNGAETQLERADELLTLFGPLALVPRGHSYIVAHLGQSLDGRIATESGHSHYIGGPESLAHLHRLRALVDAVVVGVGTVLADAPRLTVRLVAGSNPVRVVLDPRGRLGDDASVVQDRLAPTLVVHARGCMAALPPWIDVAEVDAVEGRLPPKAILQALAARGLTRVLVEGGGRTVSTFVEAGAVDRLELAVAPLLIGSGRPALSLPPVATLATALRPPCTRHDLGGDTLFVLDLRR
jgi:diaminohydroxyphosphoribosylaminopyrimidine deaminase / 5-amino-6-(5-phosphoribosylamino)uracil reductase